MEIARVQDNESLIKRALGTQVYICPICKKQVERKNRVCSICPHCGRTYPFAVKVPLELLKDVKNGIATVALHAYIHTYIFPKLDIFDQQYLTRYFTILRVQGNARGTTTSNSISVTQVSNPTSGNVLVATIGGWTYNTYLYPSVASISQTGVTWAGQIIKTYASGKYYGCVEIWFGVVATGASNSVTVNLANAAGKGAVADICEYSGMATSSFLDKTATNSGTGKPTNTGTTATTTQADELWIGAAMAAIDSTTHSTPTNGFTLLDGLLYKASLAYLEKIVSATGTANSGTTLNDTPNFWVGCIATFFAAAGVTTYTKAFTFGGHLQKVGTKPFTFTGHTQKTLSKTLTFNGHILETLTKPFTFNGSLTLVGGKPFTFDGHIKKPLTKPFTFNGLLKKALTKPFSFDGHLLKSGVTDFSFDGNLYRVGSAYVAFDGHLLEAGVEAFTFDGTLLKQLTKDFSLDGHLLKSLEAPFTFDGGLQKAISKPFTFDGALLKVLTKPFTFDGHLLKELGIPLTFDGHLQKELSKPFSFNGHLLKAGATPFTFDGAILKVLAKTFTFDASFLKILLKNFSFDAILQVTAPVVTVGDKWIGPPAKLAWPKYKWQLIKAFLEAEANE